MLMNYRFTGFLDEIYATLVVRLHHTEPFQQDSLWRRAADFKTVTGKMLQELPLLARNPFTLVLLDPETMLIVDVFPCADGHAIHMHHYRKEHISWHRSHAILDAPYYG